MQAHARGAGKLQRGGDGYGFGADRNAGEAEAGGNISVMSYAVAGQIMVLRLQVQRNAECRRVLHGPQQHLCIDQRALRLREGDAAGLAQGGDFGELLAAESLCQGADRMYAGEADRFATPDDTFDEAGFVQRRARVGRAGERGDAAGNCRSEFRFDGAETCRKVNQAGADNAAGCVDRACGGKTCRG